MEAVAEAVHAALATLIVIGDRYWGLSSGRHNVSFVAIQLGRCARALLACDMWLHEVVVRRDWQSTLCLRGVKVDLVAESETEAVSYDTGIVGVGRQPVLCGLTWRDCD